MDPSRRNAWIQTIVGRDVSDTEQLSQRHFLRQKGSGRKASPAVCPGQVHLPVT
jgi:hypothetical protein